MSSLPENYYNPLIFLSIIILIIIFRTYRNFRGVRVSEGSTIGYVIFYFLFGGFFVGTSFFEGVPLVYAIPCVAVLVVSAFWSYSYTDKRITFWRSSDGSIFYKGGIIIYMIYIAGLIARLAVDFIVIGDSAFTFSLGGTLSGSDLFGLAVTDLILSFGIGLLVGRNLRVYSRLKRIGRGSEAVPTTPGEIGSLR